ncbi:uncharacterized protein TNIN_211021 [Trichonephila inaurata madagascariensis]|uniref:Uncharacterized protein n=1 Tax=Trichonephila inaurata madagascariensis TaxID=2747483 RepID=A0A8X6YW50_9ARAC|nr:uncharacterized protein TNIN_211021 [Trichonephila inaurata madagascariensis]
MTETEQIEKFHYTLGMEKDDKYLVEETCTLKDNLELSEMSKDDNLLENSKTDELEEKKAEIENESLDPLDMSSCALKDTDEDEWLDILGNGSFKKKIIKEGLGPDTRPLRGDIVTADISLYAKDSLIEENKDIKFIVGDLDVLQGKYSH